MSDFSHLRYWLELSDAKKFEIFESIHNVSELNNRTEKGTKKKIKNE
jgi:hypothetical protein